MADLQGIYKDLETALQQVDEFLSPTNVGAIKSVFHPVDVALKGRLTELVNSLIKLLNQIKDEIAKLEFAPEITEKLDTVADFTAAAEAVLNAAKVLLANDPKAVADIDLALSAVNLATNISSVGEAKAELNLLIEKVIDELVELKKSA